MNAARAGKNALCLATISDHMIDHEMEILTSQERQESMVRMIELALDVAAMMG